MADVGITVAVGGDAKGFEAALNKARALGKGWAQQTAAENRTAADATANAWGGGFSKAGRAVVKFGGVIGVFPQAAQQAIGAISAVFSSGLGPIGAAFAALAVAGVNIWRTMEAEAKAAAERIASIYKDVAEKEEALRTRNSLDPVKRAKSRLVMGDVAGAESERDALRKSAAGLAELSKGDSLGARQGRVEAVGMSKQADEIDAMLGKRAEDAFKASQRSATEKRVASESARKEDEARARALTESRRTLAIAQAPSDEAAQRLRIGFLGQDYRQSQAAGRAAAASGNTAAAVDAQIKMQKDMAEALTIWRQIRNNSESTKQ